MEALKSRKRGRPLLGSGPAEVVPVRLDPELKRAVEGRAASEHTSTSEIIREALRRYLGFAQLAEAIDDAFARWDRAHLHEFHFPDPNGPASGHERIAVPDPDWDDEAVTDLRTTKLSRLTGGQQFVYVFDLGDDWTHLCTIADQRVDPLDVYGITPAGPAAYFGWGDIPDQYGRRYLGDTNDDDPVPPDPKLTDLPPLRPWWVPESRT